MNHNMKKRGLALLLACCCVFTAAPVAVKADNVSISTNQTPTGTYSSYTKAEVLKSDTVVYDTLSTSNNVHFYKYTAEKGGYFTVNLAQTSGKGKWNFPYMMRTMEIRNWKQNLWHPIIHPEFITSDRAKAYISKLSV